MKPIDWIILGALALVIVGVTAYLLKRKKEGKGGCGCGCQNCPSAGTCGSVPKTEEKDDETV